MRHICLPRGKPWCPESASSPPSPPIDAKCRPGSPGCPCLWVGWNGTTRIESSRGNYSVSVQLRHRAYAWDRDNGGNMHAQQEVLLELLQASRCAPHAYRDEARAWLEREIGFDGSVWGAWSACRGAASRSMARSSEGVRRPCSRGSPKWPRAGSGEPALRRHAAAAAEHPGLARLPRARAQAGRSLPVPTPCGAADAVRRRLRADRATRLADPYREEKTRPFSEREAGLAALRCRSCCWPAAVQTIPGEGGPREESACLTAREHEVAQAYAGGGDYKSVARALALARNGAKPSVVDLPQASVHNKIELHRRLLGERGWADAHSRAAPECDPVSRRCPSAISLQARALSARAADSWAVPVRHRVFILP